MSQMLPPHPPLQGPPPLPGQIPPGLAQLLHGAPPPDAAPAKSPLKALQDVIEEFPPLLHALTDPGDVHACSQAFTTLLAVQKRLMQQGPGSGPPQGG